MLAGPDTVLVAHGGLVGSFVEVLSHWDQTGCGRRGLDQYQMCDGTQLDPAESVADVAAGEGHFDYLVAGH